MPSARRSFWRVKMHRSFELLLLASKANIRARQICEETIGKLKVDCHLIVGSIYISNAENDQ